MKLINLHIVTSIKEGWQPKKCNKESKITCYNKIKYNIAINHICAALHKNDSNYAILNQFTVRSDKFIKQTTYPVHFVPDIEVSVYTSEVIIKNVWKDSNEY